MSPTNQSRYPHGEDGEFKGDTYIASKKLTAAVNTALVAGQPLLLMGEPGCGKTTLAASIAFRLGLGPVLTFHTRSDHQAKDIVYRYDSMLRFYDSQAGGALDASHDRYLKPGPLALAIKSELQRVVLIDEIDKAPRDFPNGLLQVLEERVFQIDETGGKIHAAPGAPRPIVIITSNSERDLPDAFLRRCVFYELEFPSRGELAKIVKKHLVEATPSDGYLGAIIDRFMRVRDYPDLRKRPATSELVAWLRVLVDANVKEDAFAGTLLEDLYPGVLLKTRADFNSGAMKIGATKGA